MDREARKLRVDRIDMNVSLAGEGPASGYRVIAPDTRGCGETDISPELADYNIDNLVAELVGLLDAPISWMLAARHPERVDRYVALSTGHAAAYRRAGLEQRLKGRIEGANHWLQLSAAERLNPLLLDYRK